VRLRVEFHPTCGRGYPPIPRVLFPASAVRCSLPVSVTLSQLLPDLLARSGAGPVSILYNHPFALTILEDHTWPLNYGRR
jgi:hypothetical protein